MQNDPSLAFALDSLRFGLEKIADYEEQEAPAATAAAAPAPAAAPAAARACGGQEGGEGEEADLGDILGGATASTHHQGLSLFLFFPPACLKLSLLLTLSDSTHCFLDSFLPRLAQTAG